MKEMKKQDGNSNKWAVLFLVSEVAILVLLVVMFFMTQNYIILFGAIAYFLVSCAMFLRMLDMRKNDKTVKEEIDEHKRT